MAVVRWASRLPPGSLIDPEARPEGEGAQGEGAATCPSSATPPAQAAGRGARHERQEWQALTGLVNELESEPGVAFTGCGVAPCCYLIRLFYLD